MMHVLLIEDDPEHAELIRLHIARKHGATVVVQWVDRLSKGLTLLADDSVDVILLDLGLPDSSVGQTLGTVLRRAHGIPVVVLSALDDEEFGLSAVHEGAQDYISKSWMDGELLFRSLRYAIERKVAEEELRRANRTKDEFLATLSHELRTPIGVIQGFAEILSQDGPSEIERKQAVTTILRNARLQVSLINDMLDMSRIITGKISLESKAQNLVPIINEAVEAVKLAAQSKRIELISSFDPSVSPVLGDQVRLHQIMWNLLSNAIKFTPIGGRIEIKYRLVGAQAEIEVKDNGDGIDQQFLPFVFDRFRQQDSSIRRQHGGLGQGLSIVRYLVELHGGKISVQSDGIGKGATFTILFPVIEDRKNTAEAVYTEASSTKVDMLNSLTTKKVSLLNLNGLHVLTIDDSSDSLALISILLKRHGASVTTATSAVEALRILGEVAPNVIICDIGMPIEDGYSFLQKFRQSESTTGKTPIPVAALTAYTRDEEKQEAYKAGYQVHLSKPIDESLLVQTVANLATPATLSSTQASPPQR